MQNIELYEQFKALAKNQKASNSFEVIPISNSYHKLGASKEGYPKFFICTSTAVSATPNTMLDILLVQYNLSCTFVDDNDVKIPHHFTVITLQSVDQKLQEVFFDIVVMMFGRMSEVPSKREIAIEVENLISIFSAMTCPPRKKIQGLWAELFVIERSSDPETLVKAWHDSPTSKYDFTMGRDKIEVKSTSSENRCHRFSLDQLCPSAHSRVLVASVKVRESAKGKEGLSVQNLYDRIVDKLDSSDAQMHLMKVIAETIGTDMYHLDEVFFDYVEACDTLRFYDSKDVPGVDKNGVQPGVSSVGFTSDLSGVTDIQSPNSDFVRGESLLYKSLYK